MPSHYHQTITNSNIAFSVREVISASRSNLLLYTITRVGGAEGDAGGAEAR